MADLLFEIFSEEIPARMQATAEKKMAELTAKELARGNITFKILKTFVTPRRLVLSVNGLKTSKIDKIEFIYKKGPRVDERTEVIEAFAKSLHLEVKELITRNIKAEKYFFAKFAKVKESLDVVLKRILERILWEFAWPKSMRWDDSNVKWIRPIRSLLCILNKKVLPVNYGNLIASDISFGHRFLAPKRFKANTFKEYIANLANGKVILERENRKNEIQKQITNKLKKLRVKLVQDKALLEEVAGLSEYPLVLIGKIDKQFLELPREIIISTIKTHQKYFAIEEANGKLAPYFVIVSNIAPKDKGKIIIDGNQRVLRARLTDAQFFFDADRQTTLESKIDHLRRLIFHDTLGTMFGKVQSMAKIVEEIVKLAHPEVNMELARRATILSKADLTTNLVKELPELQGVIGMYYAELDGEDKIVSQAICDHYLPKGKEDSYPSSMEGALVAIADKLHTLVGLFLAEEIPTSSKDPYSLRRQALGIIRILCNFKLNVNVFKLVSYTADVYEKENVKMLQQVNDFLYGRFKFWLKDRFRYDFIDSIMARTRGDVYSDYCKLIAFSEFLDTDEGKEFFLSCKRITHILGTKSKQHVQINEKLFNKWDKKLFKELKRVEKDVHPMFDSEHYKEALLKVNQLTPVINVFFENVLIMDNNMKVRENRLALLSELNTLFSTFADFTCIEL